MKTSELLAMPDAVRRAYMELPQRLYSIREAKGLSQMEVSDGAGVHHTSISAYENGSKYPIFDKLVRLAAFYEVSVGWLLGEEKKEERERGEWVLGCAGVTCSCSECGYIAMPREAREWEFCPKCGKIMVIGGMKQDEEVED